MHALIFSACIALATFAPLGAAYYAVQRVEDQAARAAQIECHTDSECLDLCPADDLQCDGGPQS